MREPFGIPSREYFFPWKEGEMFLECYAVVTVQSVGRINIARYFIIFVEGFPT